MRVLGIGTDEQVFNKSSAARMRQEAYAKALGQLDLVVLSKKPRISKTNKPLSVFAAYASSSIARVLSARKLALQLPKPDVVTVQDPFEVGFVGGMVAKRFSAALHVQVHTDFFSPEYARHSLVNRLRALIAGYVLRRASGIRVVSESVKANIEKRYHPHAPITVLPIFVDVQRFRNSNAPGELAARFAQFKTKLLVVGRLETEKNVELAINAFAQAAPDTSCLIIVGEGSQHEHLRALTRALHISERVFFEGTQDPAPYYALADLVLVPSKYEGYGLVIVEALAAGKPVLSNDVGVAREAGALITNEHQFASDLKQWFENGPREGQLSGYPYIDFEDYVRAYRDDIAARVANTRD